ncbi:MAG: Gfo/Idh/MocA family oxidoreductase [Candidatus Hydrogenedentes bacterium]|nr:Gfo/Idh/MocA family oxidoreductase [Candidatus Hydrogenedentota bacterium]
MAGKHEPSRRSFLKVGAITAGTAALSAKSHARVMGANDRLNAGIIGCGSIATGHLRALFALMEEDNTAVKRVCDVFGKRAADFSDQIKEAGGDASPTGDYRDVLDDPDVDYVLIATPEHSHHYLTMAALKAGKHVYCEKPLCYDIREAKEVVREAARTGLKLQVGVQGMSDDSYSSAHEAILAGKIGQVVEAQIDYVRNYDLERGPWRQGTIPSNEKPGDLDWDAWLRPRAKRPWDPRHYFEWRCYRDYSGGIATDLFVHRITRIIRACGLTFPVRAAGMGGIYTWDDGRDVADSMEVLLEYPAVEGVTGGMTVHLLGTMANKNRNPHCVRGKDATLVFTRGGWDIVSEENGEVIESHVKAGGEDLRLHHMNHHEAIRSGADLNCPPELGLYGVVASRMGNLSMYQGKMVAWDVKRQHVVAS